tara:strand:- start:710 stop:2092 length:1383 start_codon:yes stop_codon:yes gene_type:complete
MAFSDSSDTGLQVLDAVLAQQSNMIGQDVYKSTLHVSPWIDLNPQTNFPEGQGYQMTTLVYDRAIPTQGTTGSTAGVNWNDIALVEASNQFNTSLIEGKQPLATASKQHAGPSGAQSGDESSGSLNNDGRAYLRFSKKLKPYRLKRAIIESPKISLEDLMFATHREQQLSAITELMAESSRYTWENRNRDEFERIAGNLVTCQASGTKIATQVYSTTASALVDFEGVSFTENGGDIDLLNVADTKNDLPDANISNKILDMIYNRMNRQGCGLEAYGRENGRPVYALVTSSETSYFLMTEDGIRDDVRYNNARVSDLIAPLGVEKGFRGFYHLVDDLAPRFSIPTGTDDATRVLPYTVTLGVVSDNADYDDISVAEYEAAYILHPQVLETQIPNPFRGAKGVTFDPCTYRGEFKWTNIPHADSNPDGTVGYFRAILGSATKPIKPHFGYMLLYKREATAGA